MTVPLSREGRLAAEALAADGNRSEIGASASPGSSPKSCFQVAPGLASAIASGAEPLQTYEAVLADSV